MISLLAAVSASIIADNITSRVFLSHFAVSVSVSVLSTGAGLAVFRLFSALFLSSGNRACAEELVHDDGKIAGTRGSNTETGRASCC